MKVTFDENGYVNGWCMVGDNGGIDVEPSGAHYHRTAALFADHIGLDDLFLDRFSGFKLEDGKLIYDKDKDDADQLEEKKADLRLLRDKECFSVINRGWIWYSCLTLTQWRELRTWYLAWLNVTTTLTIPDRPSWIDTVDTTRIPLTPFGIV